MYKFVLIRVLPRSVATGSLAAAAIIKTCSPLAEPIFMASMSLGQGKVHIGI